jgi:glucose-6-phosphate 1-dehydrogenase
MPSAPCAIVMFGASGDLARRKLLPALYDLSAHACLAPRFRLLGFARTPMSDDEFRKSSEDAVRKLGDLGPLDENVAHNFFSQLSYCEGHYDDPTSYQRLAKSLEKLDGEANLAGNRLFYLATPPEIYPVVVKQLGDAGLAKPRGENSWTRIVIEKPYGRDLASAQALNREVLKVFDESQVYRIDHYLGKETVQNLLVFRFGNGIFEPLWNRNYISHVQITAAETLGVERRAAFYETAGALRDMIQSHVLQLVSLTAMEPPATFDATAVRNEKLKVLHSIRPLTPEMAKRNAVRGQYGPGKEDGKAVAGYRQEPGVAPNSSTPTYAAVKFEIDNWRWAGVPFYVRTGKRMAQATTEIAIQFRQAPHRIFRGRDGQPNWLVMNIQPEEGISLSFGAKPPGAGLDIRPVTMDFSYHTSFGTVSRNAYATLINDCLRGEATLFDRGDSVEEAWSLMEPILQAWQAPPVNFPNYAAGSWGPAEADALIAADGFAWRNTEKQ